ncbi:cell division protein ZipA [Alloalcanivorax mobilis]|uniref:cell division protein ZipA n=1 Tax=Alloalcanivorax mobilis TaxID=2019569 RepID=UPI000C758433|nr:cell division protein ZipA [Alloalcanivorax mobilis]
MGLNLETLIGILVILILLILADGVRRMIRERHGRLRMRIDRRFRDQGVDDEDDGYPSELMGGPRVRNRDIDPESADDDGAPPMMMDEAQQPPPRPSAEQQSLFDSEPEPEPELEPEPPTAQPEPARAPTAPAAAATRREAPVREPAPREAPRRETAEPPRQSAPNQPVLEVIVFHLIARRPERFDGQAMLSLLLEGGLRYGDMHIFHRHREVAGAEQLEFSVANAVEPGTFDIDTMEEQQFAGITFFMKLPGPGEPLGSLDRMLSIGRRMAEQLDGELKDEQHSVLTPQTMEHLRQRVQEFERRQRVSHGA